MVVLVTLTLSDMSDTMSLKPKIQLILFFISSCITFNSAFAENIRLLNQNFESDLVPVSTGSANAVSGWVKKGSGDVGTLLPLSDQSHYNSLVEHGQVAYLNAGGRISQRSKAFLTSGETYTLNLVVGRRLDQIGQDLVVQLKAGGLVLAQAHSHQFSSVAGEWSSESLSLTATSDMPIGYPLDIEIGNLAVEAGHQVNIDNATLTTAETGSTLSINQDVVLYVPGIYPDINAALDYLDDKLIQPGRKVTIQITDCNHKTYYSPIEISHPDGQFIHIVGNPENPNECTLRLFGATGFLVKDGHQLGGIDGFILQGVDKSGSMGIKVQKGGLLKAGPNLVVKRFYYGLYAELNALANLESVNFEENNNIAVYGINGSYINVAHATATNNHRGFTAINNTLINSHASISQSNENNGYYAESNSTLLANSSRAENSQNIGYYSSTNSVISASNSIAHFSNNYNYYTSLLSYLDASNADYLSNSSKNFYAYRNSFIRK